MEITFKILWTDFAINQLKDIFDFHFIKASPIVAQRLVQKIIDATIILESNPKSGRKEPLSMGRGAWSERGSENLRISICGNLREKIVQSSELKG